MTKRQVARISSTALAIGFIAVGLLGCSSSSVRHDPASSPVSTGIPGAPALQAAPPAYAGPRTGADLPNAPQSDADWAKYGANLKAQAQAYGVTDPPDVAVKMWVKPEDIPNYVNPCVEQQGYKLENDQWAGVTSAQKSQFELAMYTCTASYPPIPRYTGQYTVQNLKNAYGYMIKTEIPCLEKRGYKITKVPSESVWIATYYTKTFFPYSEIPTLTGTAEDELNAACPQWPPSEILWGD